MKLLNRLLNVMKSEKEIFNRNDSIIVALHPLSFPTHSHFVLHKFSALSCVSKRLDGVQERFFFRISFPIVLVLVSRVS